MYLKELNILKSCEARYKKLSNKTIHFQKGLNFLVGENGIGKSSILKALSEKPDKNNIQYKLDSKTDKILKSYYFDSEKMNPRISSYVESVIDVSSRFMFHGEVLQNCVKAIKHLEEEKGDFLVLIDEPESGLSPWTQIKILKLFEELSQKYQFIIATHSLVFTKSNIGTVIKLSEKEIEYFSPAKTFDWQICYE